MPESVGCCVCMDMPRSLPELGSVFLSQSQGMLRGLCQHQQADVVPATCVRGASDGKCAGILFQGRNQIVERLELRILRHEDHAHIGTQHGDPAHDRCIGRIFALRDLRHAHGGGGDDQVRIVVARQHDLGVGDCTDATGHVGYLDRRIHQFLVEQHLADGAAGEIPATARIGRRDTFGGRGAGNRQRCLDGSRSQELRQFLHQVLPS